MFNNAIEALLIIKKAVHHSFHCEAKDVTCCNSITLFFSLFVHIAEPSLP